MAKKEDFREKHVVFVDDATKEAFDRLKSGRFEERELHKFINKAVDGLKANPLSGIRIPSNLWPKEYIQRYKITNLRKYNLPNAWRLIYTINSAETYIVTIILEWFDHKKYERRFRFSKK